MPKRSLKLEELVATLFIAEREYKHAERAREALREDVIRQMLANVDKARRIGDQDAASAAHRVELVGEGSVLLIPASSAEVLDGPRCAEMLEALGARLRDLGATNVADQVPKKLIHRSAQIRVQPHL